MRFYTRKRRAPVVIIVSLIDILAILLIFFIVTTTFRKNPPQLKINLPDSKTAEQAPAAPVRTAPVAPARTERPPRLPPVHEALKDAVGGCLPEEAHGCPP